MIELVKNAPKRIVTRYLKTASLLKNHFESLN